MRVDIQRKNPHTYIHRKRRRKFFGGKKKSINGAMKNEVASQKILLFIP